MKPKSGSRELVITRIYNAPIKSVWDAWADPHKLSKWWGPRGFTITTRSKNLSVGGQWIYTMHGPDGVDYPNVTTYFVVEPHKRLEYDHGANENQKALFRVNVLFTESHQQTIMKMTMTFESPEVAMAMSGFIKAAGGNSTWDRLGEFLEEEVNNKKVFLLNRVFEAPIATVFDAFCNPEHIEKWQPPTGFGMKVIAGQVQEGHNIFYEMGNSEIKFFGRSSYQKIDRPVHISFVQEFCDSDGKNAKHPGAPIWPERWLTSVQLTEEEAGITRLTLQSEVLEGCSSDQVSAFIAERAGMTQGWTGSFDRLEEYLAKGFNG